MYLQDELLTFLGHMEAVLRSHDAEKGDSWKSLSIAEMFNLLADEVEELSECNSVPQTMVELLDVANMCMMTWTKLSQTPVGKEYIRQLMMK